MPYTVIVHLNGEEPILGEVEELPEPTHLMIQVMNPRKVDGKDLHYLAENVTNVFWPLSRINFIEILTSKEEDQIIGFVRE